MKGNKICRALLVACPLMLAVSSSAAIPSVTAYVQDGLLGHWDVIADTTGGSTQWYDVNGAQPFTLSDSGVARESDALAFSGGSAILPAATTAVVFPANDGAKFSGTVEIVASFPSSVTGPRFMMTCPTDRSALLLGVQNANALFWSRVSGTHPLVSCALAGTNHTFSVASSAGAADSTHFYVDGQSATFLSNSDYWSGTGSADTFIVGFGNNGRTFNGRIHAIRVYDHILTVAEAAKNAAVDRARFFGGTYVNYVGVTTEGEPSPFGTPTPAYGTTSVVEGAPLACSLAGGVADDSVTYYYEADGSRRATFASVTIVNGAAAAETFTSPTFEVTPSGAMSFLWRFTGVRNRAILTGSANGSFTVDGTPVAAGTSVTNWWVPGVRHAIVATPASGYRFVRWSGATDAVADAAAASTTAEGIVDIHPIFARAAASTDLYASDGLVADWEALEATDAPTNWTDRIGGRVFALTGALREDDAYVFDGSAYGVLPGDDALAIFPEKFSGTVEILVSFPDDYKGSCYIFACPATRSSLGIGTADAKSLFSGSVNLPLIDYACPGTNATFSLASSNGAADQSRFYVNGRSAEFLSSMNYWNSNSGDTSLLGCRKYGGVYNMTFRGRIHAIRVYNRILSASEALANAQADRIRYFGAEIVENVELTVASEPRVYGTLSPENGLNAVKRDSSVAFALSGGFEEGGATWYAAADGLSRAQFECAVVTRGESVTTNTATSFAVTASEDFAVTWHFKEVQYETAVQTATEGGAVRIDGGEAGAGSSIWKENGASVSLEAVPASGYRFVRWDGACIADTGAAATTLTVCSKQTVKAYFVREELPRTAHYVQRGLVAMWDGIESTGGVDTLRDLVGDTHLAITGVTRTATGLCSFSYTALGLLTPDQTERVFGTGSFTGTVEVVFSKALTRQNGILVQGTGKNNVTLAVSSVGGFALTSAKSPIVEDTTTTASTLSVGFENSAVVPSCIRLGGEARTLSETKTDFWTAPTYLSVGARNNIASQSMPFGGTIHAVRVYNRTLTDREAARNARLDGWRFLGVPYRPSGLLLIVR